jgi:hypothetical protein
MSRSEAVVLAVAPRRAGTGAVAPAQASAHYRQRTIADVRVPNDDEALQALQSDAVARRILGEGYRLRDGELVGVRLNINVLKNTGQAVHSVHSATGAHGGYRVNRGFWRGRVLTYQPVVQLRDAYCNVCQLGRERIASGERSKYPMASVDGAYHAGPWNFNGVRLYFNPKREHLFVDPDGRPVHWAEEITLAGNEVFARGAITYHTPDSAPERRGDAASAVRWECGL